MEPSKLNSTRWKQTTGKVFWDDIAPCDHFLQIYEDDAAFLDLLHNYVNEGLLANNCIIVIATDDHLKALNSRLDEQGHCVSHLTSKGQYIPMYAEELLSQFMRNDWPDEELFMQFVVHMLSKAAIEKRPVRAFGEMVALLWARGLEAATVRLEHLWNSVCKNQNFSLFCAYPKAGFAKDSARSLRHICSSHSRMITGFGDSQSEMFYKNTTGISGENFLFEDRQAS